MFPSPLCHAGNSLETHVVIEFPASSLGVDDARALGCHNPQVRTLDLIKAWLLITLLAFSANGSVKANIASGPQNFGLKVHQEKSIAKPLMRQGKSQISTMAASDIFIEEDKETGLLYAKNRMYDPETGKFLSEDAWEGDNLIAPSLHRYLYGYQNPTVYVDPDGNMPLLEEWAQYHMDTGKDLVGLGGDSGDTATAAGLGVLAGANYALGGIVETVNTAMNLVASKGPAGDPITMRATRELDDTFQKIMEIEENPRQFVGKAVVGAIETTEAMQRGEPEGTAKFVSVAAAGAFTAGRSSGVRKPSLGGSDVSIMTENVSGIISTKKTAPNAGVGSTERSFLGSSEGHKYAKSVTDGGTGTAFAGHGKYNFGSGDVTVPKGTNITLPKEGTKILDDTGRYIETGDWTGLSQAASKNPRMAQDVDGMTTWLPGAKVPNYTLTAPVNPQLNVYKNSTTVESATQLDQLVQPKMGCVQWAACTEF